MTQPRTADAPTHAAADPADGSAVERATGASGAASAVPTVPAAHAAFAGARVLVVGASSGIGRAVALRAGRAGARLVLAARRADQLAALAADLDHPTGPGQAAEEGRAPVTAVVDISSAPDRNRLADTVRDEVGQLDLVLVCAGRAPLARFAETTPDQWETVLATNVVGIHQVIRAVLPTLAPGAMVAVLSSEGARQPRRALGAYIASKAALEASLLAWRTEQPGLRFTTVVMGGTVPTDFGNAFMDDAELLTEALEDWAVRGLATEMMMDTDDVADVLAGTLASALAYPGVCLEELVLRTPSAVIGSAKGMTDHAAAAAAAAAAGEPAPRTAAR